MRIVALLLGLLLVGAVSGLLTPHHSVDDIGISFEEQMQTLWKERTVDRPENDDCPPSFTTKEGGITINGKCMQTDLENRTIYAFQGFRYGKTPDASTKFKPSIQEDFNFWGTEDTFDATHIGNKCPQIAMVGENVGGDIDCLYLNVYTPYIPGTEEAKKLPVMFFIHGGGFIMGDTSYYLPTKLLNHDVILVTIHYRLGAQGFFTLLNKEAPGNTALYDMITALKWTRDHIGKFGGDPDMVTIFGESAGSVSVNYLMLTKQAEGLFRAVIAESGSSLDYWAMDYDPLSSAKFIAEQVGCLDKTEGIGFACMLEASDEDLVRAQMTLVGTDRYNGMVGFRGAAPCIQQSGRGSSPPLITTFPREILISGDFNNVPFMTGSNRDEGSYVVGVMYHEYLGPNNLLDNTTWFREQMVQQVLLSINITDETYSVAHAMAERYCPDIDLGNFTAAVVCIIDMVGALYLKAGSWETCDYHAFINNDTITTQRFYYSFEFPSDDTLYPILMGTKETWDTGITHSDELMYIFTMPVILDEENGQQQMERVMTKLWTNFATYLDPTPDDKGNWTELGIPKWEAYEFEKPRFLLIERNLSVGEDYSKRWTISTDKMTNGGDGVDSLCPVSQEEYDDLKQKSDAYEATMIVFIIFFVIVSIAAVYFFFKARR